MFVFVVPFKSRASSVDWQIASQLCGNTINSMLANPSSDLRVVLVCSEAPDGLPRDRRLIVESVQLPTPRTQYEKMTDKYLKSKMGLALAKEFAPTWLMGADADDLVSRRLVDFISDRNPSEFWYSQFGWRHNLGSRFVIKLPNFYSWCGTSSVNYVAKEDLPTSIDDPMRSFLLETEHPKIIEHRERMGKTVRPIPFPTTVYVVNTGENHSGGWALTQHDRRTRLKMALNMRPITPKLRREFGLKPLDQG